MTRLAAALLLASCAEPLPLVVSNGNVIDGEMPAWIDGACDLLEIACELESDDHMRGSVVVFVSTKPQHGIAGQVLADGTCRKVVWVVEGSAKNLAHEIGHVFGLDHVGDPGNLMFWRPDEAALTDDQLDDVHRRAGRFVVGCP